METRKKNTVSSQVKSYHFINFDNVSEDELEDLKGVKPYEFNSITKENFTKKDIQREEKMLHFLSDNSKKLGFNVLPIVHEHKGFKERDYQEKEKRINDEIEKRFQVIKDQGYEKGYEEGVKAGQKEVYDQTRALVEEKLSLLTTMINDVLSTQETLFENHKKQIYYLVRNLVKWIIMRELKDDGVYLERLLERLLVEMNVRKNLFIQVNKKDFEKMPEILEILQKKMGALPNVRVEVDPDISINGIVLECDNGIINGTLEQQYQTLDKIFETVGIDDDYFLGKEKVLEEAAMSDSDERQGKT